MAAVVAAPGVHVVASDAKAVATSNANTSLCPGSRGGDAGGSGGPPGGDGGGGGGEADGDADIDTAVNTIAPVARSAKSIEKAMVCVEQPPRGASCEYGSTARDG